jgi:hypothetical protein
MRKQLTAISVKASDLKRTPVPGGQKPPRDVCRVTSEEIDGSQAEPDCETGEQHLRTKPLERNCEGRPDPDAARQGKERQENQAPQLKTRPDAEARQPAVWFAAD